MDTAGPSRGRPIGRGAKELLTDIKLRNAKKKAKSYKLFDGGGLFLLVSASGAQLWRFKYSFAGKERLAAFGRYPDVSLNEARRRAATARELVAQGLDPVQRARVDRANAHADAALTFEAVTREWLSKIRERLAEITVSKIEWIFATHVFPTIGALPIKAITTPVLREPILKLEERGTLELARRALMYSAKVFAFAISTGRAENNPAASLKGTLRSGRVKPRLAVPSDELGELQRQIDNYDGPATRIGLRLLALTFVRPGELRAARWDEFDFEAAEWEIPAERMKMRAPHWVPLSRQAIAALHELREVTGHSALLFPNERRPETFTSENTFLYSLYRMGYRGRTTAHGFRANASTLLNELGYDADVIERQLAHAEKNKVRAAYHRTEYSEERRAMMQDWADCLDLLAGNASVADLKAIAAARLSLGDALAAQQNGESITDWIARSGGKIFQLRRR
jgi:integrase